MKDRLARPLNLTIESDPFFFLINRFIVYLLCLWQEELPVLCSQDSLGCLFVLRALSLLFEEGSVTGLELHHSMSLLVSAFHAFVARISRCAHL